MRETHLEHHKRGELLMEGLEEGKSPRELIQEHKLSYETIRSQLRPKIEGKALRTVYVPVKAAKTLLLRRIGISYDRIGKLLSISGARARQLFIQFENTPLDVNPPIVVRVTQPVFDVENNQLSCRPHEMTRRGADHVSMYNPVTEHSHKVLVSELIRKLRLPTDKD